MLDLLGAQQNSVRLLNVMLHFLNRYSQKKCTRNFDIFQISQIFIKNDPRLKNGIVPPFEMIDCVCREEARGASHTPTHLFEGEVLNLFIFK